MPRDGDDMPMITSNAPQQNGENAKERCGCGQRAVWRGRLLFLAYFAAISHDVPAAHGLASSYEKFSALKNKYDKAGGILYKQSVLSQKEFDVCRRELESLIGKGGSLRLADETTSSVARNRIGGRIPPDSVIVDTLRNPEGSIFQLINEVEGADGNFVLSGEVPVEVRIYEKSGAGMEWHVDDVLFDPEQTEVVLTIENSSDCATIWEEGKDDANPGKRVEVETAPNSAILIKAGGARHKVTPLKYGKRVILKFVYAREGATLIDGAEKHIKQFASSSSLSRPKKQKRGSNSKKKR